MSPKNEESLKLCNLKSTTVWFDTYTYIIATWKSTLHEVEKNLLLKYEQKNNKVFSRSVLKKTMMTEKYGAGVNKCWDEFKGNNQESVGICDAEIKKLFKKFYFFVHENDLLTKVNSGVIIDYFSDNGYKLKLSDANINFIYKKIKKVQLEKMSNGVRYTKKHATITDKDDDRKTKTSIRANYIHALDSAMVRWMITEIDELETIHDCFMIPYIDTSFLVAKANEGMRIQFHTINQEDAKAIDEIFSIFIVF